jgi:predicted nucleic acid-binding protein
MTEILVDTSALIAFFMKSEKHHTAARNYTLANPKVQWVIVGTVFSETVTWIRTKVSIYYSIQIGELLRQEHRYIPLSFADDDASWELFRRYDDKKWSYTDCTILAMSQRLGINQIFAFDNHIRQMANLNVVCVP